MCRGQDAAAGQVFSPTLATESLSSRRQKPPLLVPIVQLAEDSCTGRLVDDSCCVERTDVAAAGPGTLPGRARSEICELLTGDPEVVEVALADPEPDSDPADFGLALDFEIHPELSTGDSEVGEVAVADPDPVVATAAVDFDLEFAAWITSSHTTFSESPLGIERGGPEEEGCCHSVETDAPVQEQGKSFYRSQ